MEQNRKRLKQLAHEYAHTHRRMGIYQFRNTVTGSYMVNSSMDLDKVINRLHVQLNTGTFMDRKLQEEWKQYGEQAFELITLEEIKPEEEYVVDDTDRKKYMPVLKDKLQEWKERLSNEEK